MRLPQEAVAEGSLEAWATNVATGERVKLTFRPGSRCHFFEPLTLDSRDVVFRLDWGDLNANGHPTLDADFIDRTTGRHDRKMRLHASHHTEALDESARRYLWQYEDAQHEFVVEVVWLVSTRVTATALASVKTEVIRAAHTEQAHPADGASGEG